MRVIGMVGGNTLWTLWWTFGRGALDGDRSDERCNLGRLVSLPREQQSAEGNPLAITDEVQFGAKAASRTSEGVIS